MTRSVGERFDLKAQSYDQVSQIQVELTQNLVQSLMPFVNKNLDNVLDIGCGTGHLSQLLSPFSQNLHLLDLSPNMLLAATNRLSKGNACFTYLDNAESTTIPFSNMDLIASSAAMQWFENPVDFILKCKKWLAPHGLIAIATFGPQTLQELHNAYKIATQVELNPGTRMFSENWWDFAAQKCGLQILDKRHKLSYTHHDSPKSLLQDLRNMGVTGGNPRPLGKEEWKKLQSELLKNALVNEKIQVTWEFTWMIAKPKVLL